MVKKKNNKLLKIKEMLIHKEKSQLDEHAESVAEKSGWDIKTAKKAIVFAKETYGIKYFEYDTLNLHTVSTNELEEEYKIRKEKKKRKRIKDENQIKIMIESLGIDRDEAQLMIKDAKIKRGIPRRTYLEHELYMLPEDKQEAAYKNILQYRKQSKVDYNENIHVIMDNLNISFDDAEAMAKEARDERDIPIVFYSRYKMWEYPKEKQTNILLSILRTNAVPAYLRMMYNIPYKGNRRYVEIVKKFAEEKTIDAKQKGISFIDSKVLNKFPSPIIAACYYLGCPLPDNASQDHQPSYYIKSIKSDFESIIERLGLDVCVCNAITREIYDRFRNKYQIMVNLDFNETDLAVYFTDYFINVWPWVGFNGTEYFDYQFYKREVSARNRFLSSISYAEYTKKVCNKDILMFKNKFKFNDTFAKYTKRECCNPKECTPDEFKDFVKRNPIYFRKPLGGAGGENSGVVDSRSENLNELYSYYQEHDYLIEKKIIQNEHVSSLYNGSINTIRFFTLVDSNDEVQILGCIVRVGKEGIEVDNLHMGGMGAMVDPDTGVIYSDAIDSTGKKYECHPDTGVKFKGFQFPMWNEFRTVAHDIALECKDINRHVGWDLAATEDEGVVVVEGNSMPDFILLQQIDQIGKRELYDKYMMDLARDKGIKPFRYVLPDIR